MGISPTFSDRQKVTQPGLWRLSIVACSALVGFCTYVLIGRAAGPQAFGLYLFAQWLAMVAVPAIGVGMSALPNRRIVDIQSRETPRFAAGIFYFLWHRQCSSILVYCLVYPVLVFPLSWIFGAIVPPLLLLLAGLCALPLLLSSIVGITLRSLYRFDLLAAIHLSGALSTLLLVIIATQVNGEQIVLIAAFLLATLLASMLTLALGLLCVLRVLPMRAALRPGPVLKDHLAHSIKHSLLFFFLDVIVWQQGELLLLAHRRDLAELAFYALSSLISMRVMEIAPTLLSACVLRLVLRYIPGQHYANAYDAFVKTSCSVALLTLPICVATMVFCPTIITYTFGVEYLPLVTPLRILLFSSIFGSISTVSLTHLAYDNRRQAQRWLGIVAALLKIVLALSLVGPWGMTGVALASTSAQTISAVGSIILCHNRMKR